MKLLPHCNLNLRWCKSSTTLHHWPLIFSLRINDVSFKIKIVILHWQIYLAHDLRNLSLILSLILDISFTPWSVTVVRKMWCSKNAIIRKWKKKVKVEMNSCHINFSHACHSGVHRKNQSTIFSQMRVVYSYTFFLLSESHIHHGFS